MPRPRCVQSPTRVGFEKLGARLGENLAGQSYPSALISIWNPERHPLATRDGAITVSNVGCRENVTGAVASTHDESEIPGMLCMRRP
jgi:hypothetical protein